MQKRKFTLIKLTKVGTGNTCNCDYDWNILG